jgi:ankyrin repeat protein
VQNNKARALGVVAVSVLFFAAGGVQPALLDAAKAADRAQVRALLAKGVTPAVVNAAEGDGTTALHWASYWDDIESADLLIKAGAKVNAATDLGVTPLWTASQNGSEAMVHRLLTAGADPNLALIAGETSLMVAARSGSVPVVEQLIAKGANPNAHGSRGQTALMWAVSQKHSEVVKVLLAHGADLKTKSDSWSQMMAVPPHGYPGYNKMIPTGGETALMFAARVGDLESAKLLVAAGADVNDADAWGVSATSLAAHSGFTDVVLFLLDKGADPNRAEPGFAPLHEAVMRRDEKMVAALLAHGADASAPLKAWTPTRRSSKDYNFAPELVGATPLWLAARFAEPNVMQMLIKKGADPLFVHHGDRMAEGRGGVGYEHRPETTTILMAAVGMGGGAAWVEQTRAEREPFVLACVKMAVDLGIDVNAANNDGRTALDAANTLKYQSVIQFLTEKGAKASGKKGPAPAEEK